MIAKDTTTIVRFYVTTADGFPATGKASSISANISIDGGTATAISSTITESDSTNLPGWYEFEYTFNTEGNAFITFTCANCRIMPWEEDIVEVSGSSAPSAATVANAVWNWTVSGIPSPYCMYSRLTSIPDAVWTTNNRSLSSLSVVSGLTTYTLATTGDIPSIADIQSGLATSANVTTAQNAIINAMPSIPNDYARRTDIPDVSGLSTFDPSTDTVTINATQAATMVTATGFATPSDLTGLSTFDPVNDTVTINATQAAGMATATGFATPSDLAGLSTFDPANDTVTINSTQAATMVTADVSGLAIPADIPTSDITAIKTKVDSLQNTDLTGIATATNVTTAQQAIITHGDSNWTGGGSGGSGATPAQIWGYENRTLTASPTDISSLATSSDLAGSTSTLQTLLTNILAGLYHWRVTNNVLTIYNDSHDAIATFSITRDPTGNIIAVTPINN